MAVLLLQRRHNGHHGFDKTRASEALRATTPLAPQHPRTNRPLRGVVRGLHPFQAHERPQRWPPLEALPTDTLGFRMAPQGASCQQPVDLPPYWGHIAPQTRPLQRAVTDSVPPVKPLIRLA